MRAFIIFFKPAYTPSNRKVIGGKLFIECYNETKTKVLENIRSDKWINVFINESSTITRERVINYCVITNIRYFCMEQAPVANRPFTAEFQAEYLSDRFNALKQELG
jgi:hypothetical protein